MWPNRPNNTAINKSSRLSAIACLTRLHHSKHSESRAVHTNCLTKVLKQMGIPRPFRTLLVAGATVTGGVFVLSLASSVTLRVFRSTVEAKMKKSSKPCKICKGKGAYSCKLCKCNGTIEWSPLFDPIAINPCQCPTCEGRCIQKCLNCLGKGYYI